MQYLHPKDGVYPEKVNAGRDAVNANKGRIGQNPNPIQIKFSGKLVRCNPSRCSASLCRSRARVHDLHIACRRPMNILLRGSILQ